jgi:hypothetical protein
MAAATAACVEFPAVTGADDSVSLDEAIGKKSAIVGAVVGQNNGGSIGQHRDGYQLALIIRCHELFSWTLP